MTDTTKPKGMTDEELAKALHDELFADVGTDDPPSESEAWIDVAKRARALLAPGIAAEARRQAIQDVHAAMLVRSEGNCGCADCLLETVAAMRDATPPQPAVAPQWEPKGVRAAIERAVELFGGKEDGVFNLANLSHALAEQCNFADKAIDGRLCRLILTGRNDVEKLSPGDTHWRMLPAVAPGVPGVTDYEDMRRRFVEWCRAGYERDAKESKTGPGFAFVEPAEDALILMREVVEFACSVAATPGVPGVEELAQAMSAFDVEKRGEWEWDDLASRVRAYLEVYRAARPAPVQAEPVDIGNGYRPVWGQEPAPSAAPEAPSVPAVETPALAALARWEPRGKFKKQIADGTMVSSPIIGEWLRRDDVVSAYQADLATLRARVETAERALLAEQVRAREFEEAARRKIEFLSENVRTDAAVDLAELTAQVAKLEEERAELHAVMRDEFCYGNVEAFPPTKAAIRILRETHQALSASRATVEELRAELAAGKPAGVVTSFLSLWSDFTSQEMFGESLRAALPSAEWEELVAAVDGLRRLSSGQASAGTPLVESALANSQVPCWVFVTTPGKRSSVLYCDDTTQAERIAALLSGARVTAASPETKKGTP